MTKARRPRVDSAPAITAAIAAAGRTFSPPPGVVLDTLEASIFDEVMAEFPKIDMTDHRARLCAMLAKEMATATRAQDAIDTQGVVLTNSNGNPILNPHVRVADKAIRTVLAYRRSLGITARALNGGDTRNVAIRRRHNLANEAMLDEMDDEDLLGRPPVPASDRKDH